MKAHSIRTAAVAGTLAAASLVTMNTALAESPWDFSANIGVVSNYMWRGVTQTGDQAAVQGGLDVTHESGFYAGTWASNIDWDNGAQDVSTDVTGYVPVDPITGMPELDADGNYVVVGSGEGSTGGDPSPNYELDLYAGYDYAINDDTTVGISGIYYAYPDGRDSDFAEIGISGSWKWFSLGAAYTVYGENDDGLFDDGDWYFSGAFDYALPYDFAFNARAGYYDFQNGDVEVGVNPTTGMIETADADYWNYGASITREAGDFGTFGFHWDQNSGEKAAGYDPDPKFWVSWNKEF
jgi:uncharacterized protein (TIGR02001 family)